MPPVKPPQPNPSRNTPPSRPVGRALLWPVLAVVSAALVLHSTFDSTEPDAKPEAPPPAVAPPTPDAPTATPTRAPSLPRSAPQRISIPEIAVDAPFTPLTLGASGQLNAPPAGDTNLVGWYRDGATPGEHGASIIAGHVDTKTGPAVFVQLDKLRPGSDIHITRADGRVVTFRVDSVETFSKANFPSKRVYADTASPQLRVITCGGEYDRKARDYKDNVVVFAHLDSSRNSY
ncbi:class F sortase [Streptomyces sp. bgisy100]|uniref:class F sortase n=1 Tax=Streptomyces sp. bgisy100 TaxID=3413783 RepID=UPI003D759770